MSEASRGLNTSTEQRKVGPDFFGYYAREVAELLSQDEDFLPFASQIPDLAGITHGVVREKDITKHIYDGKEGSSSSDCVSLFSDAIGAELSEFKKERLKALLRQSVVVLTREVDESLEPVLNLRRLQAYVAAKKSSSSLVNATCEGDAVQPPLKKLKLPSSSSALSNPPHLTPGSCSLGGELLKHFIQGVSRDINGSRWGFLFNLLLWRVVKLAKPRATLLHVLRFGCMVQRTCLEGQYSGITDQGSLNEDTGVGVPGEVGVKKQCTSCQTTETSEWRSGLGGLSAFFDLTSNEEQRELLLESTVGADKENEEVDDDLKFLLENAPTVVEEKMKKQYDELSASLWGMKQKLEELLDTVMCNCRPMTRPEKQQLKQLIQKLPPRNLDRVVELIQRRDPQENYKNDEIHVDLEDKDNVTLWRLHHYVEAVDNARKFSV
ncbi:hypothetical protein RJ639_010422 [Escallonia herrerae]|uniref:NET domain-containing protein n=1 Tax=Escallonia herrerae TaxID=1293975 RepID=A0AA88VWV7_9ASTE|nr:hypothetical protein RJ639_010422 [Escallonia herrerae]